MNLFSTFPIIETERLLLNEIQLSEANQIVEISFYNGAALALLKKSHFFEVSFEDDGYLKFEYRK